MPDLREPWQIANAARCGCRGTDWLCVCQNDPQAFTRPSELAVLRARLSVAEEALRKIVAEVGTSTLAHKIAREALARLAE